MKKEKVILVNEKDEPIGEMEKMEAHKKGILHRAFSVFIFNSNGEMLLQQRTSHKYHSGDLWTNACCSHPRPGEDTAEAAIRRLNDEMGFKTPIKKVFDFVYKAELDNGLTEFEFDHVFTGAYNGLINVNPEEVSDYCFKNQVEIKQSLQSHPQKYTAWFHLAFPKVEEWWIDNGKIIKLYL